MQITQLHARFVGEIVGLDTSAPITSETIAFVEDAMAKYGVCVIRDASLSDADHLRFSRAFGPLELPPPGKRIAPEIFDVGNLGADGEIKPPNPNGPQPTDFELFHTNSSFNALPAGEAGTAAGDSRSTRRSPASASCCPRPSGFLA
jgi:alpha-ketoglutarate-dependent 2,4-dichlorophenoxyacetate dioxygenase